MSVRLYFARGAHAAPPQRLDRLADLVEYYLTRPLCLAALFVVLLVVGGVLGALVGLIV